MSDCESESMASQLESNLSFEHNSDFLRLPTIDELFEVINTEETYCKKKRGRKSYRDVTYKQHDKYSVDNIIRKIQVGYINFIIGFANEVLKKIGRKDLSFIPMGYNDKKNIDKKNRNILNSKTIREIICDNNISTKYKTDINKKIFEQIEKENENILQNILNKNFLFLFDKIYYKKIKSINMKEFGFDDMEIDLRNIKLFGDLLSKEKDDNNIKERMHYYAKMYFLPQNQQKMFQSIYY